jgi:signal transduction histidine kinase
MSLRPRGTPIAVRHAVTGTPTDGFDAQAVLDHLPMGLLALDADGIIRLANERASALLGIGLLGSDIATILEPLPDLLARQEREGGDELRPELRLPGGEGLIGFRIERSPAAGGFLVVFQDITRWDRLREERDRLLQLASISEVMPAVLHELKNPLAAIATNLELQIEDAADDRTREQLHGLLTEVRRLHLTLDGLGRFHHEVISVRHHAIDDQLREAFALLSSQARAKGIDARCEVQDMPLLPFEPAALRAVAFNLFTNAVHACKAGDQILLDAFFDREAGVLRLRVSDTGPGMTPEVRARCAELFFTTKPRGSGIGLALCAGVCAAVHGEMEIDSEIGRGTRVALHLPAPRRA